MGKWLFGILLFFLTLQARGQILEPVKWTFSSTQVSENTYDIIMTAAIDKGWHMFSLFEYDTSKVSPIPLSFQFKKSASKLKFEGKTLEKTSSEKFYDEDFEQEVCYFQDKAVFVQRVIIKKTVAFIEGYLEGQACSNVCMMLKKKFRIPIKHTILNKK